MKKKKLKKKANGPGEMKRMVQVLKKSLYVKRLFDTKEKREFMDPFFGFALPLMLTVVGDLGPEEGFEFLFSQHFKTMCITTLVQVKRKEQAVEEVNKLARDLNLKLPKTENDHE